jgi:hypothetical protein
VALLAEDIDGLLRKAREIGCEVIDAAPSRRGGRPIGSISSTVVWSDWKRFESPSPGVAKDHMSSGRDSDLAFTHHGGFWGFF